MKVICNVKKILRTYLFLTAGGVVLYMVSDHSKEFDYVTPSESQKNRTVFAESSKYYKHSADGIPIAVVPKVRLIFEDHRRKRVLSNSDAELKWMLSRLTPLMEIFQESYEE